MLARYGLRSLGLTAKPSVAQIGSKSPARIFLTAVALRACPQQAWIASSSFPEKESSLPNLPPPWKLQDLSVKELEAYKLHGPDYIKFMSKADQRKANKAASHRPRKAKELEEKLGPDWYIILHEASRRFKLQESTILEEFKRQHGITDLWATPLNYDILNLWRALTKKTKEALALEVKEEKGKGRV